MSASDRKLFDDEFLKRLQGLFLIAKRISSRSGASLTKSSALGDGLEFADHRSYARGDDLRFIDWPYFARMEKLLVRLFHQHSESEVAILLDCSASTAPGANRELFDYMRQISAALCYVAIGSGRRTILQTFTDKPGEIFHTGRDKSKILPALDFLESLKPAGRSDLLSFAQNANLSGKNIGTVILISDFLTSERDISQALSMLGGKSRDLLLLHAYRPTDKSPELTGNVILDDAETGQTYKLTITPEIKHTYQQHWLNFAERINQAALENRATCIQAPSDQPFEELILVTLKQAGVLR